jgi:hypothetical protein
MTLIVSLSILMAVESAPSETVGYFKKSVAMNSWETFSYPFYSADMSVQTLIGDQFADGDLIQDISSGLGTAYYDGFGWFGDLEFLEYGRTYWINRVNATTNYFLLGKVDPQPVTHLVVGNAWNTFALNEAQDIAVLDLPITGSVDGDLIQDISTGLGTTYYDGFGWFGDLEFIEPSHTYWYYSIGTTFSWTYTPGRGVTASPLRTSK